MREQATSLRRVSIRANSRARQTSQTSRSSHFGHGDGDGDGHRLISSHLLWLRSSPRVDTVQARRLITLSNRCNFSLASGVHNLRGARGVSICASNILVGCCRVDLDAAPMVLPCRYDV
jgi:hypothetical protein